MKARDGTQRVIKLTRTGSQEMVGRIIYLEPALWDMFDRLGRAVLKTRSTYIRCELKDHRYLPKMEGVDWSETNIKK